MTTLLITTLILVFVNWVLPERQTPESVNLLILIVVTANLILTAYPIVKRWLADRPQKHDRFCEGTNQPVPGKPGVYMWCLCDIRERRRQRA